MRIAYVCYWDAFAVDGVTAKISFQAATWRAEGHQVQVFCLTPARERGMAPAIDAVLFPFRRLPGRAVATARLRGAAKRYEPQVIYLRYDMWVPPIGSLLRRFTSVAELNTDDRSEFRLRRGQARLYNRFNRRTVLGSVAGLVCVTGEIARANAPFGKPTAVITNGVDLSPEMTGSVRGNGRTTAVFLTGARAPWHGIDKLLLLAAAIPEWDFALVGVEAGELPAPPPPNLRAYGRMTRAQYRVVLAKADIGIGTLALHRAGLDEATPLKVREYLAHGLPVVIAHEDTDFAEREPWFLLRIPNEEPNVRDHIDAIREFGHRVSGRRVSRAEVAPLIDGQVKEEQRLEFISGLLARNSAVRQ